MSEGPLPPLPMYTRESESPTFTEKKFADGSIGVWEFDDLPSDAEVTHVTLIAYRGEKAVVAWREGRMALPEGEVAAGEDGTAAIGRVGQEQAGILEPAAVHLGHYRCRATHESTTRTAGAVTYRALYGVEVGSLSDFPSDQVYERRVITQRELNALLRGSYLEFRREYTESLDRYLVKRIQARQTS